MCVCMSKMIKNYLSSSNWAFGMHQKRFFLGVSECVETFWMPLRVHWGPPMPVFFRVLHGPVHRLHLGLIIHTKINQL
jgi:hypothetical protein